MACGEQIKVFDTLETFVIATNSQVGKKMQLRYVRKLVRRACHAVLSSLLCPSFFFVFPSSDRFMTGQGNRPRVLLLLLLLPHSFVSISHPIIHSILFFIFFFSSILLICSHYSFPSIPYVFFSVSLTSLYNSSCFSFLSYGFILLKEDEYETEYV